MSLRPPRQVRDPTLRRVLGDVYEHLTALRAGDAGGPARRGVAAVSRSGASGGASGGAGAAAALAGYVSAQRPLTVLTSQVGPEAVSSLPVEAAGAAVLAEGDPVVVVDALSARPVAMQVTSAPADDATSLSVADPDDATAPVALARVLAAGSGLYYGHRALLALVRGVEATQQAQQATLDGHEGRLTALEPPYDDEQARDAVAAMLTAGEGVTLTYDDAGDTLEVASTAGGVDLLLGETEIASGDTTAVVDTGLGVQLSPRNVQVAPALPVPVGVAFPADDTFQVSLQTPPSYPVPVGWWVSTDGAEEPAGAGLLDNFVDAETRLLSAHTPGRNPAGGAWGAQASDFEINENHLTFASTASSYYRAIIDSGFSSDYTVDYTVSWRFYKAAGASYRLRFYARHRDTDNELHVTWKSSQGSLEVRERGARRTITLATASVSWADSAYHSLAVSFSLDGFELFADGSAKAKGSYDASRITGGTVGVGALRNVDDLALDQIKVEA